MSTRPSLRERPLRPAVLPAPAVSAIEVDEHLVSLSRPGSYEAEQYHVLRHDLQQLQRGQGMRVFAVTSPAQGDGKTTTAINLAAALAQDPATRVLLVDADLRHPSVGPSLGIAAAEDSGLVRAILDSPSDPGAVVPWAALPNLAVLPAGSSPVLAYEVLQSPRVGEVIDAAREAYDYVVLDTPPLLPVPDCRVVGRWVDGFLMVVAADRTPRKLLEEALNIVDASKLVGLVFNGDERPFSSYHGYYHASAPATAVRGWWGSMWARARGGPADTPRGGWR